MLVNLVGRTATGVLRGGGEDNAGAVAMFCEVDPGEITGARYVKSPEVDEDWRMRIAVDNWLDRENFIYTAQNTGKFAYTTATLTMDWTVSGTRTNASGVTTGGAGTHGTAQRSYAEFPVGVAATAVYCEFNLATDVVTPLPSNVVVDVGLFRQPGSGSHAPTDGIYLRLDAAGIRGVACNSGVERQTALFTFNQVANTNYSYCITVTEKEAEFWVDNVRLGSLDAAAADAQLFRSATLPFSIRHAHNGTAGAICRAILTDYTITMGGLSLGDTLAQVGNRVNGSYQGLSGGTMGTLATYANSSLPTAAVPTNATLTANLISGLGGQCIETDTLAVTTDGIIMSYQVPAGTTAVLGKRLVVRGITIDSFVSTTLTGGGYNAVWSLAFGHTAVSLGTGEAAAAKAPRRIVLGTNAVASAAAALVQLSRIEQRFENPVYVNPGEFIAVAKKKVGTAPSAGAIFHAIFLDYGWE
jgi:hypothetical protein